MTNNNIKYFCAAERCVWQVWTSPKTGYCSKIKCPYGNMRAIIKEGGENRNAKQT